MVSRTTITRRGSASRSARSESSTCAAASESQALGLGERVGQLRGGERIRGPNRSHRIRVPGGGLRVQHQWGQGIRHRERVPLVHIVHSRVRLRRDDQFAAEELPGDGRLEEVVELEPERQGIDDVHPGQPRRGRVGLDQAEHAEAGVWRRGQFAGHEGGLRLLGTHLAVAVAVLPATDLEGAVGDVAERKDALLIAHVPVYDGVASQDEARLDPHVRGRPPGDPVLHNPRHDVGDELPAGGDHEVECVAEVVVEHVVDNRQHGDAVHPVRKQAFSQGDRDPVAAVPDPDPFDRRRDDHRVVQRPARRALADPFAEADEDLAQPRFDHREGVRHGLDHIGRKAVLGSPGRHLELGARREQQGDDSGDVPAANPPGAIVRRHP